KLQGNGAVGPLGDLHVGVVLEGGVDRGIHVDGHADSLAHILVLEQLIFVVEAQVAVPAGGVGQYGEVLIFQHGGNVIGHDRGGQVDLVVLQGDSQNGLVGDDLENHLVQAGL